MRLTGIKYKNIPLKTRSINDRTHADVAKQAYAAKVRKVFGRILCGNPCGHLVHYGRGYHTRASLVDDVVWAYLQMLLPRMPALPVISKWTKLGPALDWFLVGSCNTILLQLFEEASKAFSYPQQTTDPDPAGEADVEWHRMAGFRLFRSLGFLGSEEHRSTVRILAVAMEPIRAVHAHFMSVAHAAPNPYKTPPVLDEVWKATSTSYRALAYISTLLVGQQERLRLIWQGEGFESLQAWQDSDSGGSIKLRRCLLHAAGWITRRLYRHFFKSNEVWPLFVLADNRRRDDQPAAIAAFVARPTCCLQPGMARIGIYLLCKCSGVVISNGSVKLSFSIIIYLLHAFRRAPGP